MVGKLGSNQFIVFGDVFVDFTKFTVETRCPDREAEYCDQSVCRSVCPRAYLRNHTSKLQRIFCTHYLWPGFVLHWQSCSKMCTSGVVDDVIFSRNGPACGSGDESGCTFKLTLTRRQHRCDTEASTQTDSTWGSTREGGV